MSGTNLRKFLDDVVEAWNTRHERTCHIEYFGSEMKCDECGCWIDMHCTNGVHQHIYKEPRYCPNCGAKVVSAGAD